MCELKVLADEIDPSLTVKTDVTEQHDDKKLPILDLKVWIGKSENGDVKILYNHFMKEVSDRRVIDEKSAHGEKMKENVLVNDMCRVMGNCSERLGSEDGKNKYLNHYMKRLQYSGYDERKRGRMLKKALKKHEKKKEVGSNRQSRRSRKNDAWYLEGGKNETVMFVNSTPGERLKKKIERIAKKYKMKMKVVERRGRTVKSMIQKSYPFPNDKCGREDCVICKNDQNVNCKARGVVYEVECLEEGCGMKYIGQTGRSLYERMKEHNNWNVRDCSENIKPLVRHSSEYHEGKKFSTSVKIKECMYGKPSRRMIGEAVYINDLLDSEAMNGKNEWSYIRL